MAVSSGLEPEYYAPEAYVLPLDDKTMVYQSGLAPASSVPQTDALLLKLQVACGRDNGTRTHECRAENPMP